MVHCGKRRHAGRPITSGTRYILVGFVDEAGGQRAGAEGVPGGLSSSSSSLELHFQDDDDPAP